MAYLTVLLAIFFFVLNVNARSINSTENLEVRPLVSHSLNFYALQNASKAAIHLGQVSGLASSIEDKNHLFVFHRGSREWSQESFPDGVHFDRSRFHAIPESTIVTVDARTGEVINQWANHTFYMPHGLSVDHQGNLWVTDVAMHQVFKYSQKRLLLSLGEPFVPGSDLSHFCKPTDVAVSSDGVDVYVADGYCNSRIVKFDAKGNFVREYQMPNGQKSLLVPHSLALLESHHRLCVADRENRRIVCFNTGREEGTVAAVIEHPLLSTIYAITHNSNKDHLYAVSGRNGFKEAVGYTFNTSATSFGELLAIWKPSEAFSEPHDLALSADGRSLFVGEIHPNRVLSFENLH